MVTFVACLLAAIAVYFLLRRARRWHGDAIGLGRIAPAAATDSLALPGVADHVDPDDMMWVPPTPAQAETGLEQLRECVAHWRGKPALFVEDPDLALIVRLHTVMQDALGFQLRMTVEEVIGAPVGFDAPAGLDRGCLWNQPYMQFDRQAVSAPFGFYLHFGEAGVQNVRTFWQEMRARNVPYTAQFRGTLRGCCTVGLRLEVGDEMPARAGQGAGERRGGSARRPPSIAEPPG